MCKKYVIVWRVVIGELVKHEIVELQILELFELQILKSSTRKLHSGIVVKVEGENNFFFIFVILFANNTQQITDLRLNLI